MKAADSWAVQDAGSTNGTWVNGIKLLPGRSMCLVDGDHISFALERFFFSNGVGLLAPPIGANGQVP
jgi:pSer/pThr/pTyr-binding forkhead associated (FHA) protein